MENPHDNKSIGKRIAGIRKSKGFSQQELAHSIGVSRPSLAQIELGNRNLLVIELLRLSEVLQISIQEFLSEKPLNDHLVLSEPSANYITERKQTTTQKCGKLENILLYVLERCAGKPNVGETVLYKLLYFADFNYYELYEEHLTGAAYKKLPFGPVPFEVDALINGMINSGMIQRIKTTYHTFAQTRFLPLVKPDLTQFKASEKEILDAVINQMSDWSASAISRYSHMDLPWRATKDGEIIDYELAFYREAPFSVRTYTEDIE